MKGGMKRHKHNLSINNKQPRSWANNILKEETNMSDWTNKIKEVTDKAFGESSFPEFHKNHNTRYVITVGTDQKCSLFQVTPLFVSKKMETIDILKPIVDTVEDTMEGTVEVGFPFPTIMNIVTDDFVACLECVAIRSVSGTFWKSIENTVMIAVYNEKDYFADEDGEKTYLSELFMYSEEAVFKVFDLFKRNISLDVISTAIDYEEDDIDMVPGVTRDTRTYDMEEFVNILSQVSKSVPDADLSKLKKYPIEQVVKETADDDAYDVVKRYHLK